MSGLPSPSIHSSFLHLSSFAPFSSFTLLLQRIHDQGSALLILLYLALLKTEFLSYIDCMNDVNKTEKVEKFRCDTEEVKKGNERTSCLNNPSKKEVYCQMYVMHDGSKLTLSGKVDMINLPNNRSDKACTTRTPEDKEFKATCKFGCDFEIEEVLKICNATYMKCYGDYQSYTPNEIDGKKTRQGCLINYTRNRDDGSPNYKKQRYINDTSKAREISNEPVLIDRQTGTCSVMCLLGDCDKMKHDYKTIARICNFDAPSGNGGASNNNNSAKSNGASDEDNLKWIILGVFFLVVLIVALIVFLLCSRNRFEVMKILGEGGFGCCYLVERLTKDGKRTGEKYAMKTEWFSIKFGRNRLKIELTVFQDIGKIKNAKEIEHFPQLFANGKTDKFKYMAITLLGSSLESIFAGEDCDDVSTQDKRFERVTRVAIAALEALRDLHALGYVHRDVKPENFAIGLPPKESTIFLFDFGLVRRFKTTNKHLVPNRNELRTYCGTVKYASRDACRIKEQTPADDVEAWAFTVLSLFHPSILPNRTDEDPGAWINDKETLFKDIALETSMELMEKMTGEMVTVMKMLKEAPPLSEPQYDTIIGTLRQFLIRKKLPLDGPIDWKSIKKKEKNAPSLL